MLRHEPDSKQSQDPGMAPCGQTFIPARVLVDIQPTHVYCFRTTRFGTSSLWELANPREELADGFHFADAGEYRCYETQLDEEASVTHLAVGSD